MRPAEELDQLLVAAGDGHAWAFTDIWTTLAPSVQGFVRSRGAREPEDMTSDVFLAAFKALPTFRGGWQDFRGLVFTIARRRVVDELRARGRRPTPLPWSQDDDERAEPSAEEHALARVADHDVRALLDTLAPDQRDVLTLRIFGDLTVEQVATTVGKSVGAVKQLQRRGLETLRRRRGPHGGDEFGPTRNPSGPSDDASGRR